MRHVLAMTGASATGLVAMFAVDMVDMYFLTLLGEQELAAAVGFAGTLLFFLISVSIGLQIALGALVARSEGAQRRDLARRYCSSAMTFNFLLAAVISAIGWFQPAGPAGHARGAGPDTGLCRELRQYRAAQHADTGAGYERRYRRTGPGRCPPLHVGDGAGLAGQRRAGSPVHLHLRLGPGGRGVCLGSRPPGGAAGGLACARGGAQAPLPGQRGPVPGRPSADHDDCRPGGADQHSHPHRGQFRADHHVPFW